MTLLDISKCFDSIYTHTISWAVKELKHAKENIGDISFGSDFDRLMRHMNYNETNGICIGPETSRIFAEIILNREDVLALQKISKQSKRLGIHFEIFRYVDDYIVFAKKKDDYNVIIPAIEESLQQFNLYINHTKTLPYSRPIITEKSSVIIGAKFSLDQIFDTVIEKTVEGYVLPKKQYRPSAFSKNFINTIKNQCFKENIRYDSVSNYVISSITKRIDRLCSDFVNAKDRAIEVSFFYPRLLDELVEVIFFFYTTNPTVVSSFDLSRAIIVVDRFLKNNLSNHTLSFAELIHRNIRQLVKLRHTEVINQHRDVVPIEFLNVVLAASELVSDAHAEQDEIVRLMFMHAKHDYHIFVSCIYYIKNRAVYCELKSSIIDNIEKTLEDCSQIFKSSHLAHLCLDVLACPYIPKKVRKRVLERTRVVFQLQKFSPNESDIVLGEFLSNPWFVQWQGIDLLRMIRKKELSAVY